MFLGRVVGSVWATVKWPQLEGLKLLAVQPYHLLDLVESAAAACESCTDLVVCADVLGAGVGEDVIVGYGHAARVALEGQLAASAKPSIPIDAAVVAIVDQVEVNQQAIELACASIGASRSEKTTP
jgi:ethanolamine utilization protein EutN